MKSSELIFKDITTIKDYKTLLMEYFATNEIRFFSDAELFLALNNIDKLSEEQQQRFLKILTDIDKKLSIPYQKNNITSKMASSILAIILLYNYNDDLKEYDNISITMLANYLSNQDLYFLELPHLPYSNELLKIIASKSKDYLFAQEYLILVDSLLEENNDLAKIIEIFKNTSSEELLAMAFKYMNKQISEIEKRLSI